jgi:predicted AAA+ superfamily ATPase
MQRTLMNDLIVWKNKSRRKPLILRGARQTGKTWLLQEFGKQSFSDSVYVRLEDNAAMESLFSGSLSPSRLLEGLEAYSGRSITNDTLIILDEIQAVPRAITALKYFNEEMPERPITVAGSLLGLAFHQGISFPVGKVDFLDLFPMTFEEFLLAGNHNRLCGFIRAADFDMIGTFKEELTDLLKRYYFVGGMPEAVSEYFLTKDTGRVREIQQSILITYEADFSKYTDKNTAERCRQVWQSIPSQLAKENKKFSYSAVQNGGRGRDYRGALQFMADSGLINMVQRVAKPGIPLESYKDINAFKIFLVDVGLLGAMSDLDTRTLIEGNRLFEEFKGAYAEQYVCQQLIGACKVHPYYWSAEKSSGEIDFLFQFNGNIYPVEVKAAENLKSKSLAAFSKKYDLETSLRLSLSNYRDEGWMKNIPLYALGSIKNGVLAD